MSVFSITLESIPNSIAHVEPFVRSTGVVRLVDTNKYHNLLVAVTEAVNNAIIHGNTLDASKRVAIDVEVHAHEIVVIVTDEGRGFNPDDVPNPTLAEHLHKEGGRGVFLMQQLADRVTYEQTKSGLLVQLVFVR